MKVIEHLEKANSSLFSFEILPPLKGTGIQAIYESIDPLLQFEPAFINVTYHREEVIYQKKANGLHEKVAIRKRPGTVGICAAIKNKYHIDPVPHLICGGFSREETENALIDLNFLGIDNVLVLRGDPQKTERSFRPEKNGHPHAIDLLRQVVDMNNARFLFDEYSHVSATNFCPGVAGYPEKHFEAPNKKADLYWLKEKVKAGAEYIVTQLFFDNQAYFEFVNDCRKEGIEVPIIPGIKPLTKKRHLNFLPSFFHTNIPDELFEDINQAKNDQEIKEIGIDWSTKQCKELIEFGVPAIHFYTMGRSSAVSEIAKAIF